MDDKLSPVPAGKGGRPADPAPTDAARAWPRLGRLDSLNTMRLFAALAIFLVHVDLYQPIPHLSGLLEVGKAGTTYFIILSGFVLTWTHTSKDTIGWFYWRRFSRIWPLLAITSLLAVFVMYGPFGTSQRPPDLAFWTSSTIFLFQGWLPDNVFHAPNDVTWTLSAIAFYYLLFPFVIRFVVNRTVRQLAWMAAAMLAVGVTIRVWLFLAWPKIEDFSVHIDAAVIAAKSPVGRLSEFLLGVFLAAMIRKGWRTRISLAAASWLFWGMAAFMWLWSENPQWTAPNWTSINPNIAVGEVSEIFLCLLIAAAATRELAGEPSRLRKPALVAMGNWSYAIYLIHVLVLWEVTYRVTGATTFVGPPPPPAYSHVGWTVLALAIVLVVSWFLTTYVEQPIENALRQWVRRRRAPVAEPAPVTTPVG